MNKLLISTGVMASAVGVLATVPAQASTLTFGLEADDVSLQIDFNALLVGRELGGTTVPNSLKVTADDVTGSFIVLDDPAQITDGNIELDDSLIDALLGESYEAIIQSLLGESGFTSSQVLQAADDIFTIIGFAGDGEVESLAPALAGNPDNPSGFEIFYKGFNNPLLIDGYDPDIAESCVSNTCSIEGNVSFGIGLVLREFIALTGELLTNSNLALSGEARDTIVTLQQTATLAQLFGPTFTLATVSAELEATTEFIESNPEGTADDIGADITGGSIEVFAGNQEEAIVSQSLAAPSAVELPVVTDLKAIAEPPVVIEPVAAEPPPVKPTALARTPVAASLSELKAAVPTPTNAPNPPAVVKEAATTGGSTELTSGPISLAAVDDADVQDVPEPSILLGLLGTALAIKQTRKKTAS